MKDIYVIDGETTTQQFAKDIDDNFKELSNLTGVTNSSGETNSSSSGITFSDVTYLELISLINSSGLTKGNYYNLVDFQTKHYALNGYDQYLDDQNNPEIIIGDVEPLIIKALDVNVLDIIAKSIKYPQDIIHYDWNPNNWLYDIAMSGWDENVLDGWVGIITYREDTINCNTLGYDFRNVKFRRWREQYPEFDSGTTYSIGDKVNVWGNGAYISVSDNNIGYSISNTSYWSKIIDYSYTEYYKYNINNNEPTNFIDMLTFSPIEEGAEYVTNVFGNRFEVAGDNTISWWGYIPSILPNNVFYITNYGSNQVHRNSFKHYFQANTLFGNFENNNINNNVYCNIFGDGCYYNQIQNEFIENIMIGNATYNFFFGRTENNYFGNNIMYNSIIQEFRNNLFSHDLIHTKFYNNIIECKFAKTVENNIFNAEMNINVFNGSITYIIFNAVMLSTTINNNYYNSSIVEVVRNINNEFYTKYLDATNNYQFDSFV